MPHTDVKQSREYHGAKKINNLIIINNLILLPYNLSFIYLFIHKQQSSKLIQCFTR